jgi:hypothetical protein
MINSHLNSKRFIQKFQNAIKKCHIIFKVGLLQLNEIFQFLPG